MSVRCLRAGKGQSRRQGVGRGWGVGEEERRVIVGESEGRWRAEEDGGKWMYKVKFCREERM